MRPRQKSCQVHLRSFLGENFNDSILRPVWSPITLEPYLLVNGSLEALALIYIRAVRYKANIKILEWLACIAFLTSPLFKINHAANLQLYTNIPFDHIIHI